MIIFGHRVATTIVPGGRKETLECDTCHRPQIFEEVSIQERATLYFAPVLNYRYKRALRCCTCLNGFPIQHSASITEQQQGSLAGFVLDQSSVAIEAAGRALPDVIDTWHGVTTSASAYAAQWSGGDKPEPSAWSQLMTTFEASVDDAELREMVWSRRREGWPGTVVPIAQIEQPTDDDLACLKWIVDKLPS